MNLKKEKTEMGVDINKENGEKNELATVKAQKPAKKQKKHKPPKKQKAAKKQKPAKKQKKKNSAFTKQTFMVVAVAAVLVVALAYVFVYLDFSQRTQEVEADNAALRNELEELEVYYNNINKYKADIEDYRVAISDIMAEYPAGAKEEDILMLAVQLQQHNEIDYSIINMEEPEVVYSIPKEQIEPAGIEGLNDTLSFMQKHATYVNITNYDNLKGCIEDIYASKNRIGIDNIVYTKNEEDGTLDGSISLYFYSAAGTDKEYEAPDIAAYISGTRDLFKTSRVEEQYEAVENESGDEGTAE